MKKTLIALAAVAATGAAFAQSSVTLSGQADFAYSTVSGSGTNAETKKSTIDQSNTASTSAINIAAVEDLGAGLKAEVRYEIDPRAFANGAGLSGGGVLGRHQTFVGISGAFGSVKLGAMNAASLQAFLASSPLGTGIGSNFSGSDHTAVSVGTVRYNNSVRYDSPVFSGFGVSMTYGPGNNDATGGNQKITNLGVAYNNGPLNVVFSSLQASKSLVAVKSTYNFIGANYAMGAAKVFVGYGNGDKSAAGGVDAKVTRIGASYGVGPVTVIGQYAVTKVGVAADRKTTGLRADYALSKRTVAYVGYEAYDKGSAVAAGLGTKQNIAAVGVRHSF